MRVVFAVLMLAAGALSAKSPPLAIALSLPQADEYQVKAAYLFNFAKFIDWPASGDSKGPIVIGIIGADPFGDSIERVVRGRTIRGRNVSVRRFRTVHELEETQILFVSASESSRVRAILQQLGSAPVLTVSDAPGFLSAGGAIELVIEGGRVTFDISLKAIEAAKLRVDSQLLQIARSVQEAPK